MNNAAAAALISTAVTCLDSRQLILGKNHFLLYSIVPAIQVCTILIYKGIEQVRSKVNNRKSVRFNILN